MLDNLIVVLCFLTHPFSWRTRTNAMRQPRPTRSRTRPYLEVLDDRTLLSGSEAGTILELVPDSGQRDSSLRTPALTVPSAAAKTPVSEVQPFSDASDSTSARTAVALASAGPSGLIEFTPLGTQLGTHYG
jgi:hypothetical protein